jgi:prevent-host-death family protein
MGEQSVNVAEAKKHLSELLGRVAFGKEQILITKRGKPMAKLVPMEEETKHLAEAKGWLEEDDDFFRTMECIVGNRSQHLPRIMIESTEI